ncbi:sodium/glutamate symporter [uncultured Megasphaera sp.]|uniref:sodium/glutamate symporter n=1 Tax=uncultured Megasphaera sp. TaxID=165188 RepID=UPI002658208D|nr:sodium/glutamate symporter [uncultured Megasphaera sp.]
MVLVQLNIYQTLAAAIAVYYIGVFLRMKIGFLRRYCIPAPVVGGILFALMNCILFTNGIWTYEQDTIMQNICMMLFFTSVGYTASLSLIKRGGILVFKMAIVTTILIICQDIIGISLTQFFHINPLMGLATGSIPMVGGHGTAAAFGPLLETEMGLANGTTIAVAAATFGLVAGGLIGGPVGERLVQKFNLHSSAEAERLDPEATQAEIEKFEAVIANKAKAIQEEQRIGQTINNYRFMNGMAHLFLAMGLGTLVSSFFVSIGLVFPAYIGSMLVAALIRNIADFTHIYKVYQRESEVLGNLGLTVFLTCVLMSLKLWQLSDLAVPMLVLLLSQAVFMALFAYFVVFRVMGRNYEAAVMTSGCCGFGLGATPNAIANMTAMTELFGPAPTAFFVIPLIGSLIIDPVNASIVTIFLNFLK